MNYLKTDKISNVHLSFLFAFSVAMLVVGSFFNIPGIADKPQFTTALDLAWLRELVHTKPSLSFGFYGYFLLDFIWAPLLLIALWKFVRNNDPAKARLFAIAALMAYGLDIVENTRYLSFLSYLEALEGAKILFYALCLVLYLYVIVRKYWGTHWPTLVAFFKSSFYSLLILIVLDVLLPRATQINSIVVDLYNHPVNLGFLLLYAPIYAAVLAHYPSYFNLKGKKQRWYQKPYLCFFGIIVYQRLDKKSSDSLCDQSYYKHQESNLNYLWRTLGLFFYAALFYFIAYTSEVNFNWSFSVSRVTLLLLGTALVWLHYVKKRKDKWLNVHYAYLRKNLPTFYDGDHTGSSPASLEDKSSVALTYIHRYLKQSIFWFTGTVLVNLGLLFYLVLTSSNTYTQPVVALSLVSIVLQAISYIYYRTFRSTYKLVFFNSKFKSIVQSFLKPFTQNPDAEKEVIAFMDKGLLANNGYLFKLLTRLGFGSTGSNFTFLKVIATGGVLNAAFLLVINLNSSLALSINSSVIILSYLLLFYGILAIITKHIIYYNYLKKQHNSGFKRAMNFRALLYTSTILLIVLNLLAEKLPNELFTLKPILTTNHQENEVNLSRYLKQLPKNERRYYVAAYGGGMKANAWTLVVLKELHRLDPDFFDKTVVMSGASGGTIGIMNMAAIVAKKNPPLWDQRINDIGTANILAMDITHLLGRDAVSHLFIPYFSLNGMDRSSKAMDEYARISGNCDQIDSPKTYRDYWCDLYQEEEQFPILIANTTNIKGNHGMAVSLHVENNTAHHLLYQDADDILDIRSRAWSDRYTLSYYDAFSTSNRFPLISPAAKIETKGQYNDGGLFENSGLLSAYKLFEAVNEIEEKQGDSLQTKSVFINIVNDRDLYIRHIMKDYEDCISKINESSEISAIVNSIVATEMLPRYIKSRIKGYSKSTRERIEFKTIYLPHLFTVEDVKNVFGKTLDCGRGEAELYKELYPIVEKHNQTIRDSIQANNPSTAVVEPPMSRVMAPQAFDFMKTMTKQAVVKDTLRSALAL